MKRYEDLLVPPGNGGRGTLVGRGTKGLGGAEAPRKNCGSRRRGEPERAPRGGGTWEVHLLGKYDHIIKKRWRGISLVVQWLRLGAFTAGGTASVPGRGT